MPETRVQTPRPMNELSSSSFSDKMQEDVGLPALTGCDQLKREVEQMPAQLNSVSKKAIHSMILWKSPCSLKLLAN